MYYLLLFVQVLLVISEAFVYVGVNTLRPFPYFESYPASFVYHFKIIITKFNNLLLPFVKFRNIFYFLFFTLLNYDSNSVDFFSASSNLICFDKKNFNIIISLVAPLK